MKFEARAMPLETLETFACGLRGLFGVLIGLIPRLAPRPSGLDKWPLSLNSEIEIMYSLQQGMQPLRGPRKTDIFKVLDPDDAIM